MRKWISVFSLMLLLITCLTGCSELGSGLIRELEDHEDGIKSELEELKEGFREELNDWAGSISRYSITKDQDLAGKRELGADDYVGNYEAEYHQFHGTEYLFGGTSVDREQGNALKVTYSLTIRSGKAALYWLGSPKEHIISGDKEIHTIAEVNGSDVYEFTMSPGDNFIVIEGDNFTGSLSLKVGE